MHEKIARDIQPGLKYEAIRRKNLIYNDAASNQ